MRSFIRNLTIRGEVFLVFAICFGLGIIRQNIGRHLMPGAPPHGDFSNLGLVNKAIYQLLVLALVFLYVGRIRGWSFASYICRLLLSAWRLAFGESFCFSLTDTSQRCCEIYLERCHVF